MADESTAAAASSAAVETPTFTQYDGWDEDGTPVVSKKVDSPKPADSDSATDDTSKQTKTEDEADSAAKPKQETRRKPDAEARIKELAAETKRLKAELEEARKPKETKPAESSTAKAPESKPAEPAPTRPRPKLDDKGPDGKALYASYEDHQEALTDWKVEQKLAAREREQQERQQNEALKGKLDDARGRYTDFDSVVKPLFDELTKPGIPRELIGRMDRSTVLPDLLYTIGGTETSKADFLEACRTDPEKARDMIVLIEHEIKLELGKGKGAEKKAGASESEATPAANAGTAKPRAPKPPTEVGGRGAPGEDALIAAAKTNDFRSFDAEQTRRALASRK